MYIRPAIVNPSISKYFDAEHYSQTFEPNSLIPAMLIGTFDLYH